MSSKEAPPPYAEYPGVYNFPPAPNPGNHPPPPGYYQQPSPSAGFYPPGNYGPPPTAPPGGYGATATTVIVTQPPNVVFVGGCPSCRVGVLEDEYTCLGVLCAIFFFPLGVLCCLAMREKTCQNCGATFD
ncbi:brain protein I3-like [Anthonomus grandis grandis]|uniref:brain protein I3-like n=1 Tax=Anthonomus grandis grandis TaxID=2921223 RepID=UPI0021653773|nr:brain protein I3-like [Anthonomus grandis grandis]